MHRGPKHHMMVHDELKEIKEIIKSKRKAYLQYFNNTGIR